MTLASDGLREQVLAASETLLAKVGPAGLSMREVARLAGVSHQAPYHHFADKQAILAALVESGFVDLRSRVEGALAAVATKTRERIVVAACTAYVELALTRPGIFRIMFRPEMVHQERFPEVAAAAAGAYRALESAVCTATHKQAVGEAEVTLYWSFVHGLATLLLDGKPGAKRHSRAAKLAHATEAIESFARILA